jgi:hypothetical protein
VKTERTNITKRNTLAFALAALAAAIVLVAVPGSAAGTPPAYHDKLDGTYVDSWSFCEPVRVHWTGVLNIVTPVGRSYEAIYPQNIKWEYTSLSTGNSVTVGIAGNAITVEVDDYFEVSEATGVMVINNGKGTSAFGGLVRYHLDYLTGEILCFLAVPA